MCQPAVMIDVRMGQNRAAQVARPDCGLAQRRASVLVRHDAELDLPADIGMKIAG